MILIQKTFEVAGDSKANEKLYHLWSIVIHKQKSPNDLFKYLKRKEIGSELYSFYKDYCNYLESFGRLIECDQIYQLGIENKAKPFDKMLEGYADFIKRKQADLRMEITNEQNQKTAKITKTNGKFQVYQGEEESEVEEGGGFDFTSAQKENEREKEKMKGSTLVQKPVKQQKKLKVFKDNDDSKVPKEDRYKEPGFLHRGERKVDDNTVCCFVDGLSFEENRAAYLEANPKPEIEDPEFEISMDIGKFEEELDQELQMNQTLGQEEEDLDQEEEELDQDEKESNVDPNDNPLFAFLDSPKPLKVRNVEEITIHTKDAMKDVLDLFNQPMEEDLFSEEKSEAQAAEEIAQATELDSVLSQFKQQNPSPASPITRKPQSPTIHTKEAIQDIFEMFNQPIDKEKNDFVLYNPEDDETISKQCFQRPKVGVMVFKDEDESEEDVKHGDSDLDEFFGRGKDDKSRSEFFEKAQSDLDDNYPEFFAAQGMFG
jgi:checkpoint serine/threonine-protein kinase